MYDEFLNFIFPLAKGAGEIQLAYFRGNDLGIETKSNAYDVVTRADKESEAYIVQAILGRYPGHGILGEEGGVMGTAGSDYRWVIDPLDGTTNYSQGLPIFSVSIALQHKGETVAGVVYAPYLGELFWASKGGGAYMKSRSGEVKRLQVSAKQTLATSVLATGFPYDKDVNLDNNSDNVARIIPYVRDIRRLGSAAYDLSCIAAGLLDGYWELDLHEWDVCAANLIVREAGGVVCDFRRNRRPRATRCSSGRCSNISDRPGGGTLRRQIIVTGCGHAVCIPFFCGRRHLPVCDKWRKIMPGCPFLFTAGIWL